MARVKIDLPPHFLFSTTIPIRIGDVNYGGHVGNDAILSIAHECRVQFFNHFNYTELNLGGVGVIMGDCAIMYQGESFYGDHIEVEVGVNDISRMGFDLIYKMTNKVNGSKIAIVKTGMICFDYGIRKITALPEDVKKVFSNE